MLGFVLFVPALLWGLSGAFLAWKNWAPDPAEPLPLHPPAEPRPFKVELATALGSLDAGAKPQSVAWQHLGGTPVYLVRVAGSPTPLLIDGETGRRLPGVDAGLAAAIATDSALDTRVVGSELQTRPSLLYLDGMELPVHRVRMADGSNVYVSPTSGRVYFRADRLAWMIRFAFYGLHVWKWSSGPGQAHSYLFLLVMALGLCAGSVSGMVLLLRSSRRSRPSAQPAP